MMLHTNHQFFSSMNKQTVHIVFMFYGCSTVCFSVYVLFYKGKEKDTQQLKNLTAFLTDLHKQCKLFKVAGIFTTKMLTNGRGI